MPPPRAPTLRYPASMRLATGRSGQLSLAPHFVQKVAEEGFWVPQVGHSFIPGWNGEVDPIGIWAAGAGAVLARLE